MTHDLRAAIPLTPAIAKAIEGVRIQRTSLQHALQYQSDMRRQRRMDLDIDCQKMSVFYSERTLADAILNELDGKETE